MKVREIMSTPARSLRPEDTLLRAAQLMQQLDVGALPVCTGDGRLAGVITDRDIVTRAIARGRDPRMTVVADTMSPGAIFVFENQDVVDAVHVMEHHQIRRLAVVNGEQRLAGIVSLGDIATSAGIELSGEVLQEVSQRPEPQGDIVPLHAETARLER